MISESVLVRQQSGRRLVAAVEIVSPANKVAPSTVGLVARATPGNGSAGLLSSAGEEAALVYAPEAP
jgi:hypothetical protein